jgi:hypothetical protein
MLRCDKNHVTAKKRHPRMISLLSVVL